ncbi:MAG: heme exporter protein CcmB [Chitinophagales bacterium]|nr:heme exporter protein CcmB [Chitinophagales bacterium]MDW8274498.1 heme exporter protein CcmB [Chitinophagales bacterium]
MNQLLQLLKAEFIRQIRNKYVFAGLLVYQLSSVVLVKFIIQYMSLQHNEAGVLMAFFWLIAVFGIVNAVVGSFHKDPESRLFYYRWLMSPALFISSRLLFNFFFACVLAILAWFTIHVLLNWEIHNKAIFLLALILGSGGYAIIFTLVTAVASGTLHAASLTAVMGLPLTIPLLMFSTRLSAIAAGYDANVQVWKQILLLLLLDCVIAALSYILFPYIWRD